MIPARDPTSARAYTGVRTDRFKGIVRERVRLT